MKQLSREKGVSAAPYSSIFPEQEKDNLVSGVW